jgi:hypothetical protein
MSASSRLDKGEYEDTGPHQSFSPSSSSNSRIKQLQVKSSNKIYNIKNRDLVRNLRPGHGKEEHQEKMQRWRWMSRKGLVRMLEGKNFGKAVLKLGRL